MSFLKLKLPFLLVGVFFVFALLFNHWTNRNPTVMVTSSPTPEVFLKSYFNNKDEYNDAFLKFAGTPKEQVLAAATSHHFLARDLIAQTFSGINAPRTRTIIIVSPDHFKQISQSGVLAQTAGNTWTTPFGEMYADKNLINQVLNVSGVQSGADPFKSEHGVYTLVPFAKRELPEASILPLILRQSVDYQYFYELGEKISKMVNLGETTVIISSDFTHNASIQAAKLNDQKSIELLPGKKLDDVESITNDCKQCTAFLFGYLKNIDSGFKLVFSKNSYDLSGQDPENVTSYVGVYFTAK